MVSGDTVYTRYRTLGGGGASSLLSGISQFQGVL